jgi:chemotaxis signal transduction protein
MIVDDIDDVISLTPEMISSTNLQQRAEHIQGLTDHRGRLMMILDPVRLMTSSLEDRTLEQLSEQLQTGSE